MPRRAHIIVIGNEKRGKRRINGSRNRLSSLDAHSKRRVEHAREKLSRRFAFRQSLSLSHVAARQEVRNLVEAPHLTASVVPADAIGRRGQAD